MSLFILLYITFTKTMGFEMNDLILTQKESLTMSSAEIAELVNSRHDSVKRTIERLTTDGLITFTPSVETNGQNKDVVLYNVNKRNSYIVVARLSPEFTAVLVDRWQELESKQVAPALPQNYIEALEHLIAKEKQLIEQAPKVAFVDNCVERGTLMNVTTVAQKHKMSAVKLNKFLDEIGGVYNKSIKRNRVFVQSFVDAGYGELKQTSVGYSQPLFTTKGEQWINEKLINEGII